MTWQIASLPMGFTFMGLVFLTSLSVSIPVTLVAAAADRFSKRGRLDVAHLLTSCVALAFLGGLAGSIAGGSREGVVGDVVPAVLTLLGAYAAYILREKESTSPYLLVNGFSFLLGFFLLYVMAAIWRQESENKDFCREVFSNADFAAPDRRADRDALWREYCGLPPAPTGSGD